MPSAARGRRQLPQVVDRAELGVDRVVAAGLVADRPRRAGIARTGDQRVVPALAVGQPDRMDRRQIEDVEPELGQRRQLVLHALQAAPGAGEQLIPGAEAGPDAVNLDRHRLRAAPRSRVAPARARPRRTARPRARRRAWRSPAPSSSSSVASACSIRARSSAAGALAAAARSSRSALGHLAGQLRAGPRRACARARHARCRTGRSTPAPCTPSDRCGRPRTPRPSAPRRDARRCAASRLSRQCCSPGPRKRTTARRRSWPSRNASACTSYAVADAALGREAAVVDRTAPDTGSRSAVAAARRRLAARRRRRLGLRSR